jgi:hypothetical protein
MKRLWPFRIAGFGLMLAGLSGGFFAMSGAISSSPAKGARSRPHRRTGDSASVGPNDLTSQVDGQLIGQCPSGKVSNVATELKYA